MNVLECFSGTSVGRLALKKLKIKVNKFYTSEIDENAISISRNHHKSIELGDILNWKKWEINWKEIDLILAGPPCQAWSVSGKQKGKEDIRGLVGIEFSKLLAHAKKENPNLKFLIENVRMKKENLLFFDDLFGVPHKLVDSSNFSPQKRIRAYWTNIVFRDRKAIYHKFIPYSVNPKSLELGETSTRTLIKKGLVLHGQEKNTLFNFSTSGRGNGRVEGRTTINAEKALTITASGYSTRSFSGVYLGNGKIRNLSISELEQLQGLPLGYVDFSNLSYIKKRKLIGNGWNLPTVMHILKGLKNDY